MRYEEMESTRDIRSNNPPVGRRHFRGFLFSF